MMHSKGFRQKLAVFQLVSLSWLLVVFGCLPAQAAVTLRLNQFGTHPQAPKEVWVQGYFDPEGYDLKPIIVDPATTGKIFFWQSKKMLTPARLSDTPGQLKLDFTALQTPGIYSLRFRNTNDEPALEKKLRLNEFVYWDLLSTGLRAVVLQRSGVTYRDPVTGLTVAGGHQQPLKPSPGQPSSESRTLRGGWYDGIGYDRHLDDIALTTARLLSLYALDPAVFKTLKLNYPLLSEQVGTAPMPDLLKEATWGLQWLLEAQERGGGFVQDIQAVGPLEPAVLPERDSRPFTYSAPTVVGTAQAIATLAHASQVLRDSDLGNAIQYLIAAEKGWQWLNPSTRTTGHPSASTGAREAIYRGWAALMLYQTTGKIAYWQWMQHALATVEASQWERAIADDPGVLVVVQAVLKASRQTNLPEGNVNQALPAVLLGQLVDTHASQLIDRQTDHPYHLPVPSAAPAEASDEPGEQQTDSELTYNKAQSETDTVFVRPHWMPNAEIVADAQWLTLAALYSQDERARASASQLVDALLGFNQWDQPFMTGDPEVSKIRTLAHPCHPLTRATRTVVPGLLVTGPDADYPTDVPFQDNAFRCESTATPLALNSQFIWLMGLMNEAYKPATPVVETTPGKTRGKSISPVQAPIDQPLPEIR